MAGIALLAMLLLTLVPALGRIASAPTTAIHGAHPLKIAATAPAENDHAAHQTRTGHPQGDGDHQAHHGSTHATAAHDVPSAHRHHHDALSHHSGSQDGRTHDSRTHDPGTHDSRTAADDRPPPAPPSHQGHADCEYCPLLTSLAIPDFRTATPPALPAPAATPAVAIDRPLPSTPHPCGLGSRGPPLT